jgi:hypothetical protein
MRYQSILCSGVAAIGLLLGAEGCVDHDYDLSQDLDMTVAVGGDLTIPSSSVAPYTLKKIMNLSNENGSLRADGEKYGLAQGDYVLAVNGGDSRATFSIPVITIHNLSTAGGSNDCEVKFSGLPSNVSQLYPTLAVNIGTTGTNQYEPNIAAIVNDIYMNEPNVTDELKRLDYVSTDITAKYEMWMTLNGSNYNGTIKQGFRLAFDKALDMEIISTNAPCAFQGSDLVFTQDAQISKLELKIRVKGIDCTKLASDQGLSNRTFKYDGNVTTTGSLSLPTTGFSAGDVTVKIHTNFSISDASITGVIGVVNPSVNVGNSTFAITDIPDFLKNNGTCLDVANPQIYLNVNNTSNATANVSVVLTAESYERGDLQSITVSGICVVPGQNVICLSRDGTGYRTGVSSYVKVADLSKLISEVPDEIIVSGWKVAVEQSPIAFELGKSYDFTTNCDVVAPLAFGQDMKFTYTDVEDGWDEDLSDYNFKSVKITANAVSSIPLTMTPTARALFKDDASGVRSAGITVNVDGNIAAGTLANPTESTFNIELISKVENLDGLDGVELTLNAANPIVGEALNENQAITIKKLTLKIAGGVIVNLND